MYSLRKWMFKPKKPDESLLAEFFYTDEELNAVAAELDSFDGRKDPERCTSLVNKLRRCQDKVLAVIEKILQYVIPDKRASRDFRVKFPDDVLQDNLSGQLWFGAECLAAGSSIMNREVESASMRPLAKALTKQLDVLRSLLRDQCLRNQFTYSDKISEALVLFDKLFAEFELSYVSAMVPVKTMKEYDKLQEVMVLFCETVQRALKLGLLTQEMIDDYDPALMFTIPRLAIICGLLVYPEGPINPDMDPMNMSEMFRPFQMLLYKIRELLWTLSPTELWLLEKALSSSEDSLSLSDAAFEEQLNKLNWLQLQSKHEPLDTLAAAYSATVPSSISSQGGEADQEVTEEVNECIQDISKMETCPPEVISDSDQEDICQENCDRETTEVELISNEDTSMKIDHDTDKADDNDGSKSFPHKDDLESLCCSNRDPEYENCDTGNLLSCYSEDRYPEGDCSGCLGIDPELKEDIQPESSNHADQNKDSRSSTEQALNDRTSVSHQDSGDSGMISMSDHVSASSTKVTMDSICHTPRLYWSKSWPAHSDSSRNPSRSHRHSICCDCSRYMYNLEVLQSHCTTEAGAPAIRSQEFVFHLPCDTSLTGSPAEGVVEMDLMGTEDQQDPLHTEAASADSQDSSIQVEDTPKCIGETASEEVPGGARIQLCQRNDSHIIYTLNGQQRPCSDASHMVNSDTANSSQIAFITGALNDIFFTDPEFQGVTPPRTPSTSSSSSASCDKCQQSSGQRRQSWEPNLDCTRCKQHTRSSNNNNRSGLLPGAEKCQHHPHSNPSICSTDWDGESCTNSDTSSYTSDVNDDEEIALAIQAAEIAARQEARARFRNSSELIHKLFVCISGVADQLQTNYASDLRHILKAVFECNSTLAEEDTHSIDKKCSQQSAISRTDQELPDADTDSGSSQSNVDSESNTNVPVAEQGHNTDRNQEPEPSVTVANTAECPPHWVPDDESPYCMSCGVPFTFVRRRHHCRNCGKIFCSRCSSNSVPLPHYGHDKPVRVCNHCFIYQVTPFTVAD